MDRMMIAEALALALAVSLDTFAASFAYGGERIRIPKISVGIISLLCSAVLGLSLLAGAAVKQYIPEWLTTALCFGILFLLGVEKLLDSATKSLIRRHHSIEKQLNFSLFNFSFVLRLYADPQEADLDHSKTISPMEAASLAVALSLDGLAVGFGAAMGNAAPVMVFICSLCTNTAAVLIGAAAGNRMAQKLPFDCSWLGGVILILLAFWNL